MSNVSRSVESGVLTVTMQRPEHRNALVVAAYRALAAAVEEAAADDSVRAVILTGGGGHFTAGNDLKDFQSPPPGGESAAMDFLRCLAGFPKPLLAAVEGVAVGIGSTMLLHCDFVYAGAGARFRMPFVPLGLCPEGASTLLLARAVGPRRAAEWLLLGGEFSAAEAAQAGFVSAATEAGGALARARETARALAQLPAQAMRTTKALLLHADRAAVLEAIDREAIQFRTLRDSPDAQRAFAAFFARRDKPPAGRDR